MSAIQLVQDITWLVYFGIFLVVTIQVSKHPHRANIDIFLFFAVPALIILESLLDNFHIFAVSRIANAINGTLILSLSYILLRLVDDFTHVRREFMGAAAVGLIILSAGLFVFEQPPLWVTALQVIYFVGLQLYAAAVFVHASQHTSGVTQRRMRAVAAGSLFLGLTIFAASLAPLGEPWTLISQVAGLGSAITYFLGFAPPRILRRAWQEPELRAFLSRAAELPRLPTTKAIVDVLVKSAATLLGAPTATIGLWNEEQQVLRFDINGQMLELPVTMTRPAGRTFITQQPLFISDASQEYPESAQDSSLYGATTLLIAPITAGTKRLGVMAVFSPQTTLFADDDLALVQMLADQAAVILESRSLIDEASRMQAREEATRLKDDFLTAAAHDLKTPLTTLVGRAQLLERRTIRSPQAPADLASIQTLVGEAQRLRSLVLELLDASRAERGQLVGKRELIDLAKLAQESSARQNQHRHHTIVDTQTVIGEFDRVRIGQLIDNLLENAIKYSPEGGEIDIRIWQEEQTAHIQVSDQGIGIPTADLPFIFDRFYRADNIDSWRFAGMGLGLFICRAIVEQHGGRIWATSQLGRGTSFHIDLPLIATENTSVGQLVST